MFLSNEPLTIDAFFDYARKGKLIGLRCELGHVTVPPRQSCRVCSSKKLQLTILSGEGEVVSFTEVYVKSEEFPLETPYTLALVTLVEGGNLLGVLRGSKTSQTHGSKVRVRFEDVSHNSGKWPRTFFDPI